VNNRNKTNRNKTNRNNANRSKTPMVLAIVLVGAAIVAIVSVLATRADDDDAAPIAASPTPTVDRPGDEPDTTDGEIDEPDTTDGEIVETIPLPDELVGEVGSVRADGTALPPLGDPSADTAIGLSAPVLVGESFDGSGVTTASEGGPVLVIFLAHWCPHCNEEIPRLLELEEAGRFPDDLKIIAVSTAVSPDSPGFPPSEWIVEKGWLWPVMADELDILNESYVGTEAFGVTGFPFTTVVGADGIVLDRWSGGSEAEDFIARLDAALATA
jgi:thiol-disulfide isomerase/thioredoxin